MTVRVIIVDNLSDEGGARLGAVVHLIDEPGWWKITGANILMDDTRAYQLTKTEFTRQRGQRTLTLRPRQQMEDIVQVKHATH